MKKALFLRFLRSLLITDLFDNLEPGKNYCFEQKSGKRIYFLVSVQRINGSHKKGSARDYLGSKAGIVKRTEKELLAPVPLIPRGTSMRTQASRDLLHHVYV